MGSSAPPTGNMRLNLCTIMWLSLKWVPSLGTPAPTSCSLRWSWTCLRRWWWTWCYTCCHWNTCGDYPWCNSITIWRWPWAPSPRKCPRWLQVRVFKDCRVDFKHWRLALDFDWWNGMKGLSDWLNELCVRSRELNACLIGVYTSGYTLLPLIYLSIWIYL